LAQFHAMVADPVNGRGAHQVTSVAGVTARA
jgi:hypothetical protein